ncbi:MAG: DNA repair protein RecO [bacterium]|nr:DNA repair protein RecO [bacterium]
MAHHVYNTQGLIIESTPRGEANKMYLIFTEELGMVRASAQGVRLLKSKLRFALQEYSFARVSLVRGKDMWKVTNAKAQWSMYHQYKDQKHILYAAAQIISLLKRLIPGEEKNERLYGVIIEAFDFLHQHELNKAEVSAFERIVVLRVLHNLGYGGNTAVVKNFTEAPITRELIIEMISAQSEATKEINRSLRETQL